MSVEQPFKPQRVRGVRLMESAAELGARWHHGALDRVERERRVVVTRDGEDLAYDQLVLALGAHPEREWHAQGILTYHGGRDGPVYRLLLHRLLEGDTGVCDAPAMAKLPQRTVVERLALRVTGAEVRGPGVRGPTAMAPVAIAALAVGAVAIGRLAIGRATIKRLTIDELEVTRLKVTELEVAGEQRRSI